MWDLASNRKHFLKEKAHEPKNPNAISSIQKIKEAKKKLCLSSLL